MKNPWEEIDLDIYEKHMSLDSVFQLQTMNKMMKEQFRAYQTESIMILGIAGGNGIEHVEAGVKKIYGVDINAGYLEECRRRYPNLDGVLETICVDLTAAEIYLPHAELVIANLLIEYVGYDSFSKAVIQIGPQYVSCGIQINTDESFVSDSPYLHEFDRLEEVHYQIDKETLIAVMKEINYEIRLVNENPLPNGKKLVRVDFEKQ